VELTELKNKQKLKTPSSLQKFRQLNYLKQSHYHSTLYLLINSPSIALR